MMIETMDKAVSGRSTFDVQSKLGELHEAFGGFGSEAKALSVSDSALESSVFSKFGIGNTLTTT